MSEQPKYNIDEELSAIKSSIMTKWREIEVSNLVYCLPVYDDTAFQTFVSSNFCISPS